MTWNMQTRSMTFSGPGLPQIVGIMQTGQKISEPMLTVRSVKGREAVGELFEYVVVAQVENPDFLRNPDAAAQIDLDGIIGTPGTLAVQIAGIGTYNIGQQGASARVNVGADTRYINGTIESAEIHCVEDRAAVYEFVLRPFVWRATLNRDSRILSGSVIDVLREVFGKYLGTVDWRIAGPGGGKGYYPPRDMIRQAWESDWTFAHRLMEEWGLVYWFEHRDGFHSLVVSDTLGGYHRHGAAYETLRYHTGSRIDEEHIGELSVSYTTTPGKATVNDHDYMGPRLRNSLVPLREEYRDQNSRTGRKIEIYERAEFAQPLARKTFSDVNDAREEGRHLARVKLEAERCKALRAKGRGNLRGLQSGRTFTLTDYPQDKANREYIVLACDLEITEVGTSSGAWRTYTVNAVFDLQPSSVYYRLPQVTPRPRIDGLEFAVIVAPQDNEIWIDEHNRLLVQFDWDRQARFDGATSIWLRVMSQWQGGEMGVVTPGRAGQMVMVSHVHGDPDRPVVTGFVVDKFNPPPWTLPDNAALSGIRSKSLNNGLTSNHLVLDDTPGKQQAQLASDHGKSSVTVGYNTRIDGNKGRQEARGEGFELRTDRWGAIRAKLGMLLSTHGRDKAAGKAKDIGETIAHLTEARGIHGNLALMAQQHGTQDASGNQADVARAIRESNTALRGGTGDFPEFENPDIAISSAADIHLSASVSTHIASREYTALTTGGDVAIAALKSFYVSVRQGISLFASKAINVISASGRIYIEARTNRMDAVAQDGLTLTSKQDWVRIAAAKGIELNAGGSVVRITPQGITFFTNGHYLVHAASHATDVPQAVPVQFPVTQENPGKLVAHHVLIDDVGGFTLPNQPYRLTLDDGQVIRGVTNELGELQLATSNTVSFGLVDLMSQSEPENIISASNTAVWRDDSLPAPATMPNPARRTTRVGGKTAETPGADTTSQQKPQTFITCDPMNFGLRTYRYIDNAKADDAPAGIPYRHGIEYPVTKVYAAAVKKSLEAIAWGRLAGKSATEMQAVIALAVQEPLWSALQSGAFGLPKGRSTGNDSSSAMPGILIVSPQDASQYGMRPDVTASFISGQWVMAIYQGAVENIVSPRGDSEKRDAWLRAFADTVYHESRHCQQTFWMMSLLNTYPNDYKEFTGIRQVYSQYVKASILELARKKTFPDDELVRIGVHRMLVFHYYWLIMAMKDQPGYEFVQGDVEAAETEVCKLLNITPETARKMAQFETGYRSQLHEEDAYACAEVVQAYWYEPNHPFVRNPGTCTDKYIDALKVVGADRNA